ncbi:Tll0287-like domain-containing protein [Blastochloris tepida]|uniref:Cytochrome c n=1 Tax=Blastochloris tepida TaxID=2233851 RepID=A0A348G391_9HYPH|nr:DUF3365 domain-containing protein [Blastochloris tepida]BBF94024.1 cytochrome c [Blastochloris tepida]
MSQKAAFVFVAAVAAGALALSSNRQPDQTRPNLATEAAGLTKTYGAGLLGALKGAMEGIGPVGAVGFCHDEAPGIAADLSQRSGWTVRRTSLKPRNPAAAPDAYERKVMEAFNAKIAAGAPAASLKQAEIVEQDGKRVFRYMQAIPTAELCLACHGSELKPEVAAKIKELYPDDQATGFKPGDMRGAFTLSKTL